MANNRFKWLGDPPEATTQEETTDGLCELELETGLDVSEELENQQHQDNTYAYD